jgi:hypothetical protein
VEEEGHAITEMHRKGLEEEGHAITEMRRKGRAMLQQRCVGKDEPDRRPTGSAVPSVYPTSYIESFDDLLDVCDLVSEVFNLSQGFAGLLTMSRGGFKKTVNWGGRRERERGK